MARVLFVDDDPDVREAKAAYLGNAGHEVTLATGAADAVEKVREAEPPFDALVVDMKMERSEHEGMTVIEEALKHDEQNQIIVLTAYGSVENSVKALKAGAFDYVEKQADGSENQLLLQRIEAACGQREFRTKAQLLVQAHVRLLTQIEAELEVARRAFAAIKDRLSVS